jgi:hypothetical protein
VLSFYSILINVCMQRNWRIDVSTRPIPLATPVRYIPLRMLIVITCSSDKRGGIVDVRKEGSLERRWGTTMQKTSFRVIGILEQSV